MSILGNISSATKSLMRARQEQARLSVDAYLAQLDDETLANFGVDRKKLKKGGSVNFFI